MPTWLSLLLLSVAWQPVLILLHEVGHALAALALTDGEVSIDLRPGGVFSGACEYDSSRLRGPRAEAWIAAAGPATTLGAATLLWYAALSAGFPGEWGTVGVVGFAGAFAATLQFFLTALPIRYGAGLGDAGTESDGRAIWRILTGAPPGGIAREERSLGRPERTARPLFMVLLAGVVVLTLLVDPFMVLILLALFGGGLLLQRIGQRAP